MRRRRSARTAPGTAIGEPPVLVGDRAAPEDRQRVDRHVPIGVDRVDLCRLDHALVDPLVPEVEAIAEAFSRLHSVEDLRRGVVEHILLAEVLVRESDDVAVGKLEVVEMGEVQRAKPTLIARASC
jgi:hypothetical protein